MSYVDVLDREVFEIAKSLADKYPEPFRALEEYDRSRKLKKWGNKVRANFTLDRNLLNRLREHCREKGYKMSTFLERILLAELKGGG